MNNPIPGSIPIEQNILGLCLLNTKYYLEIKDTLESFHFSLPRHVHLYAAIQEIYKREKTVSVLLLHDYLNSNNLLETIGGIEYYVELQTVIEKTDELSTMANTIIRKYKHRLIQSLIAELNSKLSKDSPDTDSQIDNLITDIVKTNNCSVNDNLKHVSTAFKQVMSDLIAAPEPRLRTGFILLDEILGGFCRKNLVLIAARPSMGKTMLALNIAMNLARNGHPVSFLSLEMSEKELILRAVTSLTHIPYKSIFDCTLNSEQYQAVASCANIFTAMPLHITEQTLNLGEIRRTLVKAKSEHKLEAVFIDYLQLIAGVKYTDNRNLEIGGITRELKALAKELDIVVVLLSQLNRSLESRPEKRPIASDLRDSGSIEQDADIVLFIYRDVVYNPDADRTEAEIIINKNRNGESHKTVKLKFDGKSMNFMNGDGNDSNQPFRNQSLRGKPSRSQEQS